jgi:predicted CXXCH cytochrome family protein
MATPGRTQKQIAERYKGNLGYYKKKHPWRVARWCASLLAISGGIAGIIVFQERGNEEFFSSGKISNNHAAFAQDCATCHDRGAALGDGISLAKFKSVVKDRFHRGIDFTSIDRKCEQCHKQHTLHEPNVVENRSCSVCHQEHLGPGRMRQVADLHCASCHGSSAIMEASAQKGAQLPPAAFHLRPNSVQQVVFEMPRPGRGYTQVFSSFAGDHPEFQLVREKARDPDVIRFNHQRHFAADIPPVKGQKLDCNYCHKTDPEGRFYQRISFAANCQACHALLFDKYNPQLHVPHGDVNLVRTFLRTLPAQYGDYARLKQGKTRDSDVQTFVAQQIKQLREQFRTAEELESAVFFSTDPYKPQRQMTPNVRANFAGCAFCHDVKAVANGAPAITKPVLVDRWMPQARFNHAKHRVDPITHEKLDCNKCHRAVVSRETSDLLMPAKADCVTCHSPKGQIVSECITCHEYHAPPQVAATDMQAGAHGSFKQMLLGSNR